MKRYIKLGFGLGLGFAVSQMVFSLVVYSGGILVAYLISLFL